MQAAQTRAHVHVWGCRRLRSDQGKESNCQLRQIIQHELHVDPRRRGGANPAANAAKNALGIQAPRRCESQCTADCPPTEDKQREQLRAAAAAQLAAKGEQGPSSPALSAATDESLSLGQTDSDSGAATSGDRVR